VKTLTADLARALADGRRGEILRDGVQVAIVGPPNAGKSSLLNALAGRQAAIVFDEPGTTRDVIEVAADLDGYPFIFRDTAGLRETTNAVEREGVRRALASAVDADILLVVHETNVACLSPSPSEEEPGRTQKVLAIRNKIDLLPASSRSAPPGFDLAISAKTGEGLDALKAALIAFATQNWREDEAPLITRARHRQEIQRAHEALTHFLDRASNIDAELAAQDLREAADALGRLTGRLDVEDILGQIFSEFCIGK
jgi:tRNA modification GTPase